MIIISLTLSDLQRILFSAQREYKDDTHTQCVDIEITVPTIMQGESDCFKAYLQNKDADFDSLPIFTNEK